MRYSISKEFKEALEKLVDSLPHGQVKGIAVGFGMPEHCSEIEEAPEILE
jgi:hypothetical protein